MQFVQMKTTEFETTKLQEETQEMAGGLGIHDGCASGKSGQDKLAEHDLMTEEKCKTGESASDSDVSAQSRESDQSQDILNEGGGGQTGRSLISEYTNSDSEEEKINVVPQTPIISSFIEILPLEQRESRLSNKSDDDFKSLKAGRKSRSWSQIFRKTNSGLQNDANFEENINKDNVIGDKDRYPTANDHIFWTELGIDPKMMIEEGDLKLKPKYLYKAIDRAEAFGWGNEKIFVFKGNTKEDKKNNMKQDQNVLEAISFTGEILYTGEPEQEHFEPKWFQFNEVAFICQDKYDEQNQCRAYSLLEINMITKKPATYDLKTKNRYRDQHKLQAFQYGDEEVILISGFDLEEKYSIEFVTKHGEILSHHYVSERDTAPTVQQIDEYLYFMDFHWEDNKPTSKIEVKKFNMISKELSTHKEIKYKAESVRIKNTQPREKEMFELAEVDSCTFIQPIDKKLKQSIEDMFVVFHRYDVASGAYRFHSLRKMNNLNHCLGLFRFGEDLEILDLAQAKYQNNNWFNFYIKEDENKIEKMENDKKDGKEKYEGLKNAKAKILYNRGIVVESSGDPIMIDKCIRHAQKEVPDQDVIYFHAYNFVTHWENDESKKRRQEESHVLIIDQLNVELDLNTWQYNLIYCRSHRFGGDDNFRHDDISIRDFKRNDNETALKFEQGQLQSHLKPSNNGFREQGRRQKYMELVEVDGKPEAINYGYKNIQMENFITSGEFFCSRGEDRDKHFHWLSVINDRVDQQMVIFTSSLNKQTNEIRAYCANYERENRDVELEQIPEEEDLDEEHPVHDREELLNLKISLEQEGEDQHHLKVQYKDEEPILLRYRINGDRTDESWNYSSELIKDEHTNKVHIQVHGTSNSAWNLLKEYVISFDKSQQQQDSNLAIKLVGWKFILAKDYIDGKMKMCSQKQPNTFVKKLFLRHQDRENCIVIKNLDEQEYMYQAQNINSSFYYHVKDGFQEYLEVDIRLQDEKVDAVHAQLPNANEDLDQKIFLKLLATILSLKPKQTHLEFWMGRYALFDIDVFQHRVDLDGFSYASKLGQEPKDFQRLLYNKVHDTQTSIILKFYKESGHGDPNHPKRVDIKHSNEQFFRESLEIREEKDVCIGIDFRTPVENCLFIEDQPLSASSSVIGSIITHMHHKSTPHNQLSIQMLVPHILFHDLGKVCEETSVLFENYAYEAGKGSFFEELTAANLPTYFEQYEQVMIKEKFSDYCSKDYTKNKDEQTINDIIEENEGKANSKFCRTFIMDKDFYNINLIMSELCVSKDEQFFRYKEPYNVFQQGLVLSEIINQFGEDIEHFNNVRAMIDYYFEQYTVSFFKIQQLSFVMTCVLPIFILVQIERDSSFIIPCLIVSFIGELIFAAIEVVNYLQEGFDSYFNDKTNIPDYSLFISHTAYVFLKISDYCKVTGQKDPLIMLRNKIDTTSDQTGSTSAPVKHSDALLNIIYIIECFMFFCFLTKIMNQIKIYRDYGRLTVLVADSIWKVIPFMVLFVLWTGLFAMQYIILGSNHDDVEDQFKEIIPGLGFMIVAFENGIGNIISPSVGSWDAKEDSITKTFIIYLIYVVWMMNQFILLVVLLNFVIALISEVYERVMDQRMIYEYQNKQGLNAETQRFYNTFKSLSDEVRGTIPQIILLNSEKKAPLDLDDYIGCIQTFKKLIRIQVCERIVDMDDSMSKQQEELKEQITMSTRPQKAALDFLKKEFKIQKENFEKQKEAGEETQQQIEVEMKDLKVNISEMMKMMKETYGKQDEKTENSESGGDQ